MKIASIIKKLKMNPLLVLVGVVVVSYLLYNYSDSFKRTFSGMTSVEAPAQASPGMNNYQPNDPSQLNKNASASGITTDTYGLPPSCAKQEVVDPKELLPSDTNSEFSKLNPMGAGDLKNVSLLKAGHHVGINTVGQSLRNANLQLRSEPANPQMNVGPWNQTSITADNMRKHLEIGSSA